MPIRNRQDKNLNAPEKTVFAEDFDDKKKSFFQKTDNENTAALIILTILSFVTRFFQIHLPAEVVFDEVHFGKFASYYLKRTYYFDVHPPLGKLMFAAAGWILGFDGQFEFTNIGDDYIKNGVPYVGLRALPATLGALFVPLTYLIMTESGYPTITAILAAGLVLFDNALICQTRLILLDSSLVFFMLCTLYCYIRFYKYRLREFTNEWWSWLIATGVTLGLTLSVKMVGLFTVITIGYAVLYDLWNLLDINRGLTMEHIRKHFLARVVGLIIVPIAVYLFWFYIHFLILNTSGPGDAFMSPAFQQTLHGNIMNLQSMEIRFNDTITLKHKDTSVFLHSHTAQYPLRYDDGRVSSKGQQVTGYPHLDSNNHWRIKPADTFFDSSRPENDTVKHGDYILLEHVNTRTNLLTHDVASPTMPTNQEFTTISVDDNSRYNETIFQIFINDGNSKTVWKTKSGYFRLVHHDTKVALWTHAVALPEWGFKQQEINGNKNNVDKTNTWFPDEIVGKNATEQEEVPKKQVKNMAFLKKFFELQRLMISHNSGLTKPHPYSSSPINWPFLVRGISFWTSSETKQQIYLLGNPFTWWLAIGAMAVLVGVMSADILSRRRGIQPIPDSVRNRLYNSAGFFFLAWALHYFPFYLMGRSLFLHHYLPSVICSYLVTAAAFNFMFVESVNYPVSFNSPSKPKNARSVSTAHVNKVAKIVCVVILIIAAVSFIYLAQFTYGFVSDSETVSGKKWLSSWDFHFQRKVKS